MNRTWFFNVVDRIERDSLNTGNRQQYSVVRELKSYIQRGTFTRYCHAKEILSYWGMSDKQIMELPNSSFRTKSNINAQRTRLSDDLYDLFGEEFLEKLKKGDKASLDECKYVIDLLKINRDITDFIPQEFVDYIFLHSETQDFKLNECTKEYQFLKRYSVQSFKRELRSLNINKVFYMLRILKGEAGKFEETYKFIASLERLGMVQEEGEVLANKD